MISFKKQPCAVCQEKDKTIQALNAQIDFLKHMVQPPAAPYADIHMEANALLNGAGDQIVPELNLSAEVLSERESLLSGTY